MKRRENGTGSYRYTRNGKLEYRFHYMNQFGDVLRKSVTGVNEYECLEKAEAFLAMQDKINHGIDIEATIPDIIKYRCECDLHKNYIGEQGFSRNIATLGVIERSCIGNIPIFDLTHEQLEYFLRTITSYSDSVITKVYQQLRLAYNIAVERHIVDRNLMLSRDLRCPKSKKKTKNVKGFTEEEQKIFIDGLKAYKVPKNRNTYKAQLLIELFTGMRMGEINALKPENLDFKRKMIQVRATVSRGLQYEEFIKEGTKTYAGLRDIPMNKMVEPLLREAVENMKKNPEGLIFYDYNKEGIIATYQVNSFFRRVCEKYDLPYYGQHALRHTFATRCIEANIPPVVIKDWMGHKNIHVTLDTYADVFKRMNFSAMGQLEEYLDEFERKQEDIEA